MSQAYEIRFTIPGELINWAGLDDLTDKAKEAFVMLLLREGTVTQGDVAEILGLTRWELMQTMDRYGIPVIDLTGEELGREVEVTEKMLRGERV